jgi:hypothetical protein
MLPRLYIPAVKLLYTLPLFLLLLDFAGAAPWQSGLASVGTVALSYMLGDGLWLPFFAPAAAALSEGAIAGVLSAAAVWPGGLWAPFATAFVYGGFEWYMHRALRRRW